MLHALAHKKTNVSTESCLLDVSVTSSNISGRIREHELTDSIWRYTTLH